MIEIPPAVYAVEEMAIICCLAVAAFGASRGGGGGGGEGALKRFPPSSRRYTTGKVATWMTPGSIEQQWSYKYDSRCADVKHMQVQEIFAELWPDSPTSAPRGVMTSHAGENQRPRRSQSRKTKISKKSGIAVGDVEIFPNIRLPMDNISLWIQLGGLALAAAR
jgi:hypothetical protein